MIASDGNEMSGKGARKKRVLFVGEGVTLAHVLRPLELSRGLDRSRYDVHFACDSSYQAMLHEEDLRFWPLPTIASSLFLKRATRGLQFYRLAELQDYAHAEFDIFRRVKPDIVVGDFRVTLSTTTEVHGVPLVTITQAHWSPHSTRQCPVPDHPVLGLLGEKFGNIVFQRLRPIIFRHLVSNVNKLRANYKLPPLNSLLELHTSGTQTLYCDPPSFASLEGAPDSHHVIGPILAEPKVPIPEWGKRLPKDRPIVFLSAGSSGDVDVFQRAMDAVSACSATLVVATAGRIPIARLPSGAFAADYVPGSWAAEVSDLVICNGGSGAVYQALAYGKAVLGIPSNLDQLQVMSLVMERGLGKMLRIKEASAARLESTVRSLISDTYRSNLAVDDVAREIRDWNATEEFTRLLTKITVEKSA